MAKEILVRGDGRAVFAEDNGKHLDYCLCMVCPKRKQGEPDNCAINEEMGRLMTDTGTKIPVWECVTLGEIIKKEFE